MEELEQFIDGVHLRGVSYRTDAPYEIIHPRIVKRDGEIMIYRHDQRHQADGPYLPVKVFLRELVRGTPGLTATGYRANKKQTTLTFDKRDRVEISPALRAYLSREVVRPHLDAEANHFKARFLDRNNSSLDTWLPKYREATVAVASALRSDRVDDIIDLIWVMQDNSISHAGQGTLGRAAVERVRPQLVEMTKQISADGTPESFQRLGAVLERWATDGLIPKNPRLVLARAFAAIHPDTYHTVVDGKKHAEVAQWCARHTGFINPGGNWASQAAALSAHLTECEIAEEPLVRNIFPWFVYRNLVAGSDKVKFVPGHRSRVANGTAEVEAGLKSIQYRQNVIQDRLVDLLRRKFGDSVATEHPTGTGGSADALVLRQDGQFVLYEIKPARTASDAVRQAMGQLLEYSYRGNGLEAAALVVVSNAHLDRVTEEYLDRLRSQFSLPLEYMQVADD
ncbi:TPA: hypothetical protein ACKQCJ_000800 [Stenotrophomonas maltophilia]|uniref:hypothetical protein n=1 Tax=Stenotrophomonas sp. CC22-02 TaxID=1378087 RepID=UPI0010627760|nr:hypothetical protein [Stenotrophomonas sp. CC22-02]TDV32264.1 hypothetical protein N440_3159 [Stenotrophomonas sp. CC22-02]HDS1674820.1 hypothetical protein [Stenotrophomonas maltophilia]